jgi:prevent-host-death family protein
METVNIHEAKTQLSRLIERVRAGDEGVITKAGKPVARLVPVVPPGIVRKPGSIKGRIRIAGDLNAPLREKVSAVFVGRAARR